MEDISRAVRVHRASASGRVLCANPQTESRWSHLFGTCAILLSIIAGLAVSAASAGAAEPSQPRIYELVTPAKPSEKVNVLPTDVVGEAGNEVVFQTKGNRETGPSKELNTYLSRRTANGWQTRLLSPPSVYSQYYDPEYENVPNDFFVFNSDLSKGIFATEPLDPPLVEGEPAAADNLYEQETATGANTLVTTLPGSSTFTHPPRVAAASANLEHVLFETGGDESTVYAWSPEEGMTEITPNHGAVAGAGALTEISPDPRAAEYSSFDGGNPHAISENGDRIFLTDRAPNDGSAFGGVSVLRNQGKPNASSVGLGQGTFLDATPNGRKALFASCDALTPNSTASGTSTHYPVDCLAKWENKINDAFFFQNGAGEPTASDLYIYSEPEGSETGTLTDITTQGTAVANVLGVLGESEDLSRVYFVATGVLAPGGTEGKPNLYVWAKTGEATEETTFIATLETSEYYFNSEGDNSDWEYGVSPLAHNARVSQNGEYVAFASQSPTIDPSYDNINPEIYEPLPEVYLYKHGSSGPICVSCEGAGPAKNPAGIANIGLSELERNVPSYPDSEKRNLLNDGTLYFESGEKLAAADENETTDVYEYNAEGGTIGLISSGNGEGPSHFMGATADASNVFFSTDQALLPADENNSIDIYDARINGGVVSPLPTPRPCQDGCPATPGSATFYGPGVPPPPPPAPAVKPFAVAKITAAQIKKLAKTGKLTLHVTVPGPGRLAAKALAKLGKVKRQVASSSLQVNAAGEVQLTLTLSKKARAELAKVGKLAVEIKVSFASMTKTAHLTLKQKKPKSAAKGKKSKGKKSSKKSTTGGSH
jgi:hypothetical protein